MNPRVFVLLCATSAYAVACAPEEEASPSTPPSDPPPVDADADGFTDDVDCDDGDAAVYPGAPEVCDGVQNDCAGGGELGLVTIDGTTTVEGLAAALEIASPGSELRVCGSHQGPFVLPVPVHIVGYYAVLSAASGPVLTVPDGTELESITVTSDPGGADRGGGILMQGGSLVLRGVSVERNSARIGAGIAVPPGASLQLLEGTRVANNHAQETAGGVLAEPGATVTLDATSRIEFNDAPAGGGIWLDGATLIGGTVDANSAEADAGYDLPSIAASDVSLGGGNVLVTGVSAIDGATISDGLGDLGAGALVWASALTVTASTFVGSPDVGDTLAVIGGSAVLDDVTTITSATTNQLPVIVYGGSLSGGAVSAGGLGMWIERSTVTGTTVSDCAGTSAAVLVFDDATLIDVVIEDSSSDGLYALPRDPYLGVGVGQLVLERVTIRNTGHPPYYSAVVGGLQAAIPVVATDSVIEKARTGSAAYSSLVASAPVSWTGGAIRDGLTTTVTNFAAAIGVSGEGSFTAVDVDFGTGSTENTPVDVMLEGPNLTPIPYDWVGVGSHTCTPTACD